MTRWNMVKWSLARVDAKVEWEGGIYPALQWGIKSEDIEDKELAYLWAKIEEVLPVFEAIEKMLSAAELQDELL